MRFSTGAVSGTARNSSPTAPTKSGFEKPRRVFHAAHPVVRTGAADFGALSVFLTAPLFGAVAGLILAVLGPDTLQSRWSSGALAMTHLIVVDFMLQAMCGSLLQFVAVVAGANIWRPRLVAAVVHPLITAGAIFLASAFLLQQRILFLVAAAVFMLALGLFLTVLAIALWRTPARGMSIHVLRVAVFGLLVTMLLGATLALTLGLEDHLQSDWSLIALINVHVAWGLAGWALMLVIGVSYLVVPMFQMTPSYPVWLTRLLPAGPVSYTHLT